MTSTFVKTTPAQVLMNKGKRGAAAYIYAECRGTGRGKQLDDLLDLLLTPGKPIDDWETIDWCKWLMACGCSPDEFSTTVIKYDNATTCGLVWTPNFVAYRCRTCGISPCMALCTDCFKRGNHYRHDFNMFLSQAGGACDCGDTNVMKESGFCDKHGPNSAVNKPPAPSDLMFVAEAMMPRMILRLIQHLRENCKAGADYRNAIQTADAYLKMLLELNDMGALMRRVMTSALTNPQKYQGLMDPGRTSSSSSSSSWSSSSSSAASGGQSEYDAYCQESHVIYQDAIKNLPNPEPPDEYKDCPSLQEDLVHTTFLEELMFWTVAYEFPQKLVCLLLSMLPDPDYKESLTRAFVLHYSRIAMMLERSGDPETLSNSVVHVSVQLFSNNGLAVRMVDEFKLLHVMVISLKYMMSKILVENTLHAANKNFHYVVDCARQVMKEHCYWPLVSDLNNVLSHKPVAVRFLTDDPLLEMWFDFLSMFQGMNVNQREMGAHVEFEPTTYYAAFSAELEASAYPMWALVSHLKGPESASVSRRALSFCLTALQDWLDAIGFTSPDVCDVLHVSFHIPLHRYFAVFMCQAVRQQGITLQELLPPTDMLHLLMMHPLRIQVAFYEILNGLWVRNGLQIKGQAMTYIQCNFCNSMVDADLYLLQICATKLQPDVFINTVIDKFHVKEWLSLRSRRSRQNVLLIGEHDAAMMESCLIFLATLINVRTNLGLSDSQVSHLEMVTLLCMGDKTHSQLIELMPERCGTTPNRDFEEVLADVAQYRAPNLEGNGIMQQGMYGPKSRVWDDMYDPLHVLLRAVHRRDYQVSMDRFTEYVTSKSQSQKKSNSATLWPPFRYPAPVSQDYDDPRIVLRTRIFHAMIYSVLFKAVNDPNISEHMMALAVYLLEMAVVTTEVPDKQTNPICPYTGYSGSASVSCSLKDMDFGSWYETDSLIQNLQTFIPRTSLVESRSDFMNPTASDWDIGSDVTESSLMINDEFEVEIGEQGDVWELELLRELGDPRGRAPPPDYTNDHRNTLPALPSSQIAEWDVSIVLDERDQFREGNPQRQESQNQRDNLGMPIRQRALPPPPASLMQSISSGLEAGAVVPMNTNQRPLLGNSENEVDLLQVIFPRLGASGIMVPSTNTENISSGIDNSGSSVRDIVPSTSSSHYQQQSYPPSREMLSKSGESIISLLLKLHSQLSGSPDSWSPDETGGRQPEASSSSTPMDSFESRIGDGPYFIGQLLRKISELDDNLKHNINETRNKLWPRTRECEDAQREVEHRDREERRKKAKERQQKLMAEFANKQKQFMKKAMETEDASTSGMEWDQSDPSTTSVTSKKEYDCVICNQTTPSTEEKPMGLVVLVQSTSVLGHERLKTERVSLPTSDDAPRLSIKSIRTAHFDYRLKDMRNNFNTSSWLLSINIGLEGGVHVQTCGHHLHLDCLNPYRQSLKNQPRQQSLAVNRGEYLCPLCRQLANSVLPMSPQLGESCLVVKSRHPSPTTILEDINSLLMEAQRNPVPSNLSEAMGKAMEEITAVTYLKYKQKNSDHQYRHESLFLFITSVARTNFEVELVQHGGKLYPSPQSTNLSLAPKRDCIVALLHVLTVHARLLIQWPIHYTWQQLTGLCLDNSSSLVLASRRREVPLLLKDPIALLIQFVLLLPLHIDQTYFGVLVKVIYNLLYYQVVLQVSCYLRPSVREEILAGGGDRSSEVMRSVIKLFSRCNLYEQDVAIMFEGSDYEENIQNLCLPFLRIAALLRHHLYSQPLPQEISKKTSE
uniref:E3 ubiquitin-protein ligase n=1 Tax=Fopius arisanus TaxID=64838 RepID=A0A0C9QRP8_9HYME